MDSKGVRAGRAGGGIIGSELRLREPGLSVRQILDCALGKRYIMIPACSRGRCSVMIKPDVSLVTGNTRNENEGSKHNRQET